MLMISVLFYALAKLSCSPKKRKQFSSLLSAETTSAGEKLSGATRR